MGIDFFSSPLLHFAVFYGCAPFSLPSPDCFFFFFTRQVLVSCYKSNEEQLKCTTGRNPVKTSTSHPRLLFFPGFVTMGTLKTVNKNEVTFFFF